MAIPARARALERADVRTFQKIEFGSLNARQKDLFNFQKIAATLVEYGFLCMDIANYSQEEGFLAFHLDKTTSMRIALKSKLTIARRYLGKDVWIAFPYKGVWYLIAHECLVEKISRSTTWLESDSWQSTGVFSSNTIGRALLSSLHEHSLGEVYGPLAEVNTH